MTQLGTLILHGWSQEEVTGLLATQASRSVRSRFSARLSQIYREEQLMKTLDMTYGLSLHTHTHTYRDKNQTPLFPALRRWLTA